MYLRKWKRGKINFLFIFICGFIATLLLLSAKSVVCSAIYILIYCEMATLPLRKELALNELVSV